MSAASFAERETITPEELDDEILESFKLLAENNNAVFEAAEEALRLAGHPRLVEPVVKAHARAMAAREAFANEMLRLALLVGAAMQPYRMQGKLPPSTWKTSDGTDVCSFCKKGFPVGDLVSVFGNDPLHGYCILPFCSLHRVMP